MDWATLWFVLLGVLMAGYAILDGFDFGVGLLSPLARTEHEKRLVLNSIGPLWDGNEVWLVTFGGALFAAFPVAYAAIFSGMYGAFMAVLGCLIFRACAIEFRGKINKPAWKATWDTVFTIASFGAPLVFGVGVGNAMQGVPVDETANIRIGFFELLTWYPLLIGVLTVVMFAMHGGLFLQLKVDGDLRGRIHRMTWKLFFAFVALFLVATCATLIRHPHATKNFDDFPMAYIVVVLMFLAVANIPRCLRAGNTGQAFVSSCCTIAALVLLFGTALFPYMVVSSQTPEYSLTVQNACSSKGTLILMTIIAALGLPFVLAYTGVVYWTFRGKVKLDQHSY